MHQRQNKFDFEEKLQADNQRDTFLDNNAQPAHESFEESENSCPLGFDRLFSASNKKNDQEHQQRTSSKQKNPKKDENTQSKVSDLEQEKQLLQVLNDQEFQKASDQLNQDYDMKQQDINIAGSEDPSKKQQRVFYEKNEQQKSKHVNLTNYEGNIFELSCPKTKLNIMQFCILFSGKQASFDNSFTNLINFQFGSHAKLHKFLEILSNIDKLTNNQLLDKQSNLIADLKPQLIRLIFLNHASSQDLTKPDLDGAHPMCQSTAFEIALKQGDIQAIESFLNIYKNDYQSLSTDEQTKVLDSVLSICLETDMGSTLAFIINQEPFIKEFYQGYSQEQTKTHKLQNVLFSACEKKAKNCVRFLLSFELIVIQTVQKSLLSNNEESFEQVPLNVVLERLATYQLDRFEVERDLSILNELIYAQKKYATQNSISKEDQESLKSIQKALWKQAISNVKRLGFKDLSSGLREMQKQLTNDLNLCQRLKKSISYPTKINSWPTVLFWLVSLFIYFSNIFIIQPKLNMWYFIFSVSTISLKFFIFYWKANRREPGYLRNIKNESLSDQKSGKAVEPEGNVDWNEILKSVPQKMICSKCKVVRTESTVHCPITDTCIDRYDQFSPFTNNAIGKGNHAFYYAYVFYLWLFTFLVGYLDYESIKVTKCDLPDNQVCPLDFLCLGQFCHSMILHYFSTYFGAIVCLIYFFPGQLLCCRHAYYFCKGQTTFERRGKHWIDMAYYDCHQERSIRQAPKKRSCWQNHREMCCNRKVKSQNDLFTQATESNKQN